MVTQMVCCHQRAGSLYWALGIGEKACDADESLAGLGIKDVENGPDQ